MPVFWHEVANDNEADLSIVCPEQRDSFFTIISTKLTDAEFVKIVFHEFEIKAIIINNQSAQQIWFSLTIE